MKALKPTLVFSLVFALLHLLFHYIFPSQLVLTDIVLIHVIMFLLTFGGFYLLLVMYKIDPVKAGFTFLAISTIKLLVSASVILILFKGLGKPKIIGVHYAFAYFFYIAFLSFQVFRLINGKYAKNNSE